MFVQITMYIHEEELIAVAPVTGELLDAFLANGFYRYGQLLFTTNYIEYSNTWHDVFWLRTHLPSVKLSNSAQKISKLNKSFRYTISPLEITSEMEELFSLYRNHVSFDHADSIHANLYGQSTNNFFNSYVIKVYDGDLLIAFGCFDKGLKSIAGIINAYHPSYKKYSLGKYLILLKLNYCTAHNITYYYTGYIGIGLPYFDYKVFPDQNAIEVFLPENKIWDNYNKYGKEGLAPLGELTRFLSRLNNIDKPL